MHLAAGDDLESTKLKLGGQRIVKRFTRGTMFVCQTNRQFLARLHADQREVFHQLPNLSDTHFASVMMMILKQKPPFYFYFSYSFLFFFRFFLFHHPPPPLFCLNSFFFFEELFCSVQLNFWVSAFTYLL